MADYFDLIGGTSTGAIIAAALAKGMGAHEVEKIYLDFGGRYLIIEKTTRVFLAPAFFVVGIALSRYVGS
ncbi:hypothetical protein GCM10007874_00350 [Labrys miyagiensis]|uniref:PNPLA domain-containing protein n=1 Tax=Labrys miyagiensis TaxID=346912 RepID=A0ABQ6CE00_9HYPH|nr:patatin-like phospholipase family protein [Labrys miyagiensis]GLS17020.1 hypothetical protein GCM10007874_00350 [Labrys miyagiensis]